MGGCLQAYGRTLPFNSSEGARGLLDRPGTADAPLPPDAVRGSVAAHGILGTPVARWRRGYTCPCRGLQVSGCEGARPRWPSRPRGSPSGGARVAGCPRRGCEESRSLGINAQEQSGAEFTAGTQGVGMQGFRVPRNPRIPASCGLGGGGGWRRHAPGLPRCRCWAGAGGCWPPGSDAPSPAKRNRACNLYGCGGARVSRGASASERGRRRQRAW